MNQDENDLILNSIQLSMQIKRQILVILKIHLKNFRPKSPKNKRKKKVCLTNQNIALAKRKFKKQKLM